MRKTFKKKYLFMLAISLFMGTYSLFGNITMVNATPDIEFQGKTGFLPEIDNFKVDIEEEKQNITKSLNTTKPLNAELAAATKDLQEALEMAKKDFKPETVSELEKVFAVHLGKIASKMAIFIEERPKLEDSFTEIEREFDDSVSWINNQTQKLSSDIEEATIKLKEMKKNVGKIARDYQKEETPELKNKLVALKNEIKLIQHNIYSSTIERDSLKNASNQLGQGREMYGHLGKQIDFLIAKLELEKTKFDRIIELRERVGSMRETLFGLSGGTQGAVAWAGQVKSLWKLVDSFSSMESEISTVLNTLFEIPTGTFGTKELVSTYDLELNDWIDTAAEYY